MNSKIYAALEAVLKREPSIKELELASRAVEELSQPPLSQKPDIITLSIETQAHCLSLAVRKV